VILSTRRVDAAIEVGTDFGFTGTTLVAADRITIGDRVLAGGNVSTVDFDVHPLAPEVRAEAANARAAAPTVIGDDVFVGIEALILKGVTVAGGGRRRQRRRDAGRAASHRSGKESGPGRVEALREFSQPIASTTTRLRKNRVQRNVQPCRKPSISPLPPETPRFVLTANHPRAAVSVRCVSL
jgi:hypothetical protein